MAHHAGVLAALQVASTQHELCHLLGVGLGAHVIGQQFEVHALEIVWVHVYRPDRNPAWLPHPLPHTPRAGPQPPPPFAPRESGIHASGTVLPQPEA